MSAGLEWLRSEAAREGLTLTDADLTAILSQLEQTKAGIVAIRPAATDGLESPYSFAVDSPSGTET